MYSKDAFKRTAMKKENGSFYVLTIAQDFVSQNSTKELPMNDRVRTSISRLIDDMSTPQDDSEKDGAMWKPSATKMAEMEQKYASTDPGTLTG